METDTTRLRRLVADEAGECCEAEVADRLARLEALSEGIPDTVDRDVEILKTLGSETRFRIVRLLAAAEEELCVCEITPVFEVSDSAVSHALSDLTDAGLLSRRKEGTWRYYGTTDRADRLLAALDATRGADE
ncbi:metalloregulator ArsR/SmtB family transcription factor [Halogeometricum sp. CBA1124]|jgi:DNA-binding transcriptional ArsR family regulator|uniref:ArsR/SmtB family transcription factor n=1 Tax=Halogeometricum sp. CBA1124 TaxID=2668071 RepID=UPI00142AF2F4|nr:metalloregulator ArsR/SmtB family transcription factor [Halogeometricum sp. CBA1124]MUV57485.1 metalloregulator ArsR/SmtB family transcription factor [Halogeometricum sp. CBA1124]